MASFICFHRGCNDTDPHWHDLAGNKFAHWSWPERTPDVDRDHGPMCGIGDFPDPMGPLEEPWDCGRIEQEPRFRLGWYVGSAALAGIALGAFWREIAGWLI